MSKNFLTLDTDRIKRSIIDVWAVLHAVGLEEGAKRQARGALVRCPWHLEKRPSCSVRCLDGGIMARCFACGAKGDLYAFIAAARGLDVKRDFLTVKAEALRISGYSYGVATVPPLPRMQPARLFPPDAAAVWERCGKVYDDRQLRAQLQARGIDPAAVTAQDLARAILLGRLPRWCSSWPRSGHRLVLPLYDALGNLASLHGRILAEQQPDGRGKGRFPAGYTNRGLVMADATARDVMAAGTAPWWNGEVHISEGATDYLTLASRWGDSAERLPATLGIYQGAWSAGLAARIPRSSLVRILTDIDETGRKYAAQIQESLGGCKVLVWKESQNDG